jgi:hypothetical protein
MGRKTLKIQQEMANKMQEYTKTLQGYRGSPLKDFYKDISANINKRISRFS